MTESPQQAIADLAPLTELGRADLGVCEAARELADFTRGFVIPPGPGRTQGYALEDVLRLRSYAEDLVEAVVVAERVYGTSWEDIAEVAEVARSTAHARWSAAENRFKGAHQDAQLRYAVGTGPHPDHDAGERIARLDAWLVRHREHLDPDHGPHPVADRIARMDPLAEIGELIILRGIVLDEFLSPPPELMAPIARRAAVLYDRLAADEPSEARRREHRHTADMQRAYARELEAQIHTAPTPSATDDTTAPDPPLAEGAS
ncbi:hypothetical protein [Nocardia sp. CDC160]|uniref:hypothetical protein n=1 Tax=Nocardia sp. CDC160 TaxID=3112166 RepID=UPI002DBCE7E1|nr:hypothetical protein [Nocardia sp. CDC160]MEC3920288.1 hypothetical protein [Nocardia sp. CDC160]